MTYDFLLVSILAASEDYNYQFLSPRLLSFIGLDFNNCVSAMATCNTPMLHTLDVSYVSGFNDAALYKLLAAPKDTRPGKYSALPTWT